MARQTEVSQRARAHMLTSPFGTIHAANFSFPQPVGTQIPEPPSYRLASFGPTDPESTGSLGANAPVPIHRPNLDFPTVNRRLKGDLLVTRPREDERPANGTRDLTPGRVKTVSFPKPSDRPAIDQNPGEAQPAPQPEAKADAPRVDGEAESNAAIRLGRLYFGHSPFGEAVGTIQPWPSEEEVQIETPVHDLDIKRSALALPSADDFNFETPSASAVAGAPTPSPAETQVASLDAGQTIAPKGEVTGPGKRPRTPAERLGLNAISRPKSEKCLADAIYFEARGEVKRGQIAVAQVVMNRVFSGYYPTNVCGVVYQNSHRKLACQFTFACDGIPDVITEPDMWTQAKEIARDMLDGKLWLTEIGHSTHYHAYWVHPGWVNEMRKLYKIGVHSFYRPRNWGDGSEVPPLNQSQAPVAADPSQAKS
jgi:spore germination cell wall hydrolase CwlJ-like protein